MQPNFIFHAYILITVDREKLVFEKYYYIQVYYFRLIIFSYLLFRILVLCTQLIWSVNRVLIYDFNCFIMKDANSYYTMAYYRYI
jgi:hypothetical protein